MKKKRLLFGGFVLFLLVPVFLFLCPAGAFATLTSYTYASTDHFGKEITYTLTLDTIPLDPGGVYDATFRIEAGAPSSTEPDAWADVFIFNLFSGPEGDISGVDSGWTHWDPGNDPLLWYGKEPPNLNRPTSFSGFYLTGLDVSTYQSGVQVAGAAVDTSIGFSFQLSTATEFLGDSIPFQVVYYIGEPDLSSGEGGKEVQTARLSRHLVPEPASMLLLGSGLIGLAGLGRKRFRKG